MGLPVTYINGSAILQAITKALSAMKSNKFGTALLGGQILSLGIPKVDDILGGDSELEEFIESQLAEGMSADDITEVKKSINFIGSMFKDGVWAQPLKEGQVHRYLIIDFAEDKAMLTVNRNQFSAIKRARNAEREKWQYKSTRKKR